MYRRREKEDESCCNGDVGLGLQDAGSKASIQVQCTRFAAEAVAAAALMNMNVSDG